MSAQVVTTPEADEQIDAIDRWWRTNRPAAPSLFAEELADCFALLQQMPNVGRRYGLHPATPHLRRLVLRSSRYHVYYVIRGDLVAVLAVWHSRRGQLPVL